MTKTKKNQYYWESRPNPKKGYETRKYREKQRKPEIWKSNMKDSSEKAMEMNIKLRLNVVDDKTFKVKSDNDDSD